jgi:hypothetical protein
VRSQIFLSKILLSKEGDFTNEDIQIHLRNHYLPRPTKFLCKPPRNRWAKPWHCPKPRRRCIR